MGDDLAVGLAVERRGPSISSSRSGLKFSMMPLWTSATPSTMCGWALHRRRAVRRPAGVGDADVPGERLGVELALEVLELALGPPALDRRRRLVADARLS